MFMFTIIYWCSLLKVYLRGYSILWYPLLSRCKTSGQSWEHNPAKVSDTKSTGMYIVDIFSVMYGTLIYHLTIKCMVIQICSNGSYEHEVMEYRAMFYLFACRCTWERKVCILIGNEINICNCRLHKKLGGGRGQFFYGSKLWECKSMGIGLE